MQSELASELEGLEDKAYQMVSLDLFLVQFWVLTQSGVLCWYEWLKNTEEKIKSYSIWEGHLCNL